MQPVISPLTDAEALEHAMQLRERHGLSYPAIQQVLGLYHGQWYANETWRHRLRAQGATPKQRGQCVNTKLENL